MTSRARHLGAPLVAALALLSLTGCVDLGGDPDPVDTGTAGDVTTVAATDVAVTASGALESTFSSAPEVDCGGAQVPLVVGQIVHCLVIDPDTSEGYDGETTITAVDGTAFDISIVLTAYIGADPSLAAADAPTVPAADIAGLAADSLSTELGEQLEVTCGSTDVPIEVGFTLTCWGTYPDTMHAPVAVEITEFDGSTYSIHAEV